MQRPDKYFTDMFSVQNKLSIKSNGFCSSVFVSVLILCTALRPHHSHVCSLIAVILLGVFAENLVIFIYFPLKVCLKHYTELLKILVFVVTKGISSACNPHDENDDAKES